MLLLIKTGLESVEARLLVYKKNESVYEEDIKVLKRKIYLKEVAITELRRKLELALKQKDEIQLTVENFENSSKNLNKLLDFSDPTVKKHVVETSEVKASADKPKVVRKNNGAPIIEDWVSDSEEEDVPQAKKENKIVKSSFAKIEFVKSKKQVKSPRKTTVKQVSGKNVNTARPKAVVNVARPKAVLNAIKGNQGNPQIDLQDQGVIDSGCLRHMTGNMSYLTDFKEIDGGYVAFGGNPKGGKITGRVPRKNNMYSVDLRNIIPKGGLTCLFAKVASDKSKLWHRRLGHINFKTMNKLVKGNLVRGLPSKLFKIDQTCVACQKGKKHRASYQRVKIIRCDNRTEFKNKEMNQFCERKGIKREFSVVRTPQQNGVAKKKNRTLIEAVGTMLADSKLPTTFWAEAVNTACYVQNRDRDRRIESGSYDPTN
ncbi:ribonuclease H-like domain-containing protein [Tanacetum coccineum]